MTDRMSPPPEYRVWWDTEWSSVEWRGELDPDLQGLDLEWSPIEPGNDWSSDEAKALAAQGVAEAIAACWRHRDRIAAAVLREAASLYLNERRGDGHGTAVAVWMHRRADLLEAGFFSRGLDLGPDRSTP